MANRERAKHEVPHFSSPCTGSLIARSWISPTILPNSKRDVGRSQHARSARSKNILKVDLRSFFKMDDIAPIANFEYGSLPRSSTARKSEETEVVRLGCSLECGKGSNASRCLFNSTTRLTEPVRPQNALRSGKCLSAISREIRRGFLPGAVDMSVETTA